MEFKILDDQIIYEQDNTTLAAVVFDFVDDRSVVITRTWVDDLLRGQGIASQLLEKAAKYFSEKSIKVIPNCLYAKKWFDKHDEYSHLVL